MGNLHIRSDMPTVLFDNMMLARRNDVPLAIVSFFQQIPGDLNRLEVFRGGTTIEHLKKMTRLLCQNLDYYPTRNEIAQSDEIRDIQLNDPSEPERPSA